MTRKRGRQRAQAGGRAGGRRGREPAAFGAEPPTEDTGRTRTAVARGRLVARREAAFRCRKIADSEGHRDVDVQD